MLKFEISQQEIDALVKGFEALPDEMKVKNLNDGVKNLANVVKKVAKQNAPKDTGKLDKAIRTKKIIKRYQIENQISHTIYVKFIKDAPQCKRNRNPAIASMCEAYPLFVHQGHKTRGGGFVPENPYLIKALESVKSSAPTIVKKGMLKGMDRLVTKIFGKGVTWQSM
jgi:HK97 gp10 family phage protein